MIGCFFLHQCLASHEGRRRKRDGFHITRKAKQEMESRAGFSLECLLLQAQSQTGARVRESVRVCVQYGRVRVCIRERRRKKKKLWRKCLHEIRTQKWRRKKPCEIPAFYLGALFRTLTIRALAKYYNAVLSRDVRTLIKNVMFRKKGAPISEMKYLHRLGGKKAVSAVCFDSHTNYVRRV